MQRLTEAQPTDHGTVSGLIGALTARYPFLGAAPVGRSGSGHKVWGLTLGGGRHRVLITARSGLLSLICLRLCEDLCEALDGYLSLNGWDVHRAMIGRTVVFVPMTEPDYHHCTASREKMQPSTELASLCHRCSFRHIVTLDDAGEGIAWRHDTVLPPDSELMARVLGASSGYALSDTVTHDFKDWFIGEFHRPAFALSLGEITRDTLDEIYNKALEMLLISVLL